METIYLQRNRLEKNLYRILINILKIRKSKMVPKINYFDVSYHYLSICWASAAAIWRKFSSTCTITSLVGVDSCIVLRITNSLQFVIRLFTMDKETEQRSQ